MHSLGNPEIFNNIENFWVLIFSQTLLSLVAFHVFYICSRFAKSSHFTVLSRDFDNFSICISFGRDNSRFQNFSFAGFLHIK